MSHVKISTLLERPYQLLTEKISRVISTEYLKMMSTKIVLLFIIKFCPIAVQSNLQFYLFKLTLTHH